MIFYTNGIVIQRESENPYRGIDGSGFSADSAENWYFNNDDELSAEFEPFYDENINRTFYGLRPCSFAAVCTDIGYIRRYIAESEKRGIRFRLLLCETELSDPLWKINIPAEDIVFLGYDYAYAGGDYYSALYNEIPFVFPQFEKILNSNRLFETPGDIGNYISARQKFERESPPYTIEAGDFIIYKLSEICRVNSIR